MSSPSTSPPVSPYESPQAPLTPGPQFTGFSGSRSYPWLLLAFLTLLNVVNFVDRQLITSLQVPIREELGLSPLQITVLAGYAFAVIYAIAGLLLGTVADRWHRPRLIALGLFVWSALTAASGLAQDFWQLGMARFFIGIGEATLTPAAIAMLGDVFHPRQRALASGLYYLGIPVGAGLSLIIASLIGPIPAIGWSGTNWRSCFIALGVIGVVLVGALLFIKDPARGGSEKTTASPYPGSAPGRSLAHIFGEVFGTLRCSPALVMTMIAGVLINIPVGSTWLDPSWLVKERGFDHSKATWLLGVAFILGGSIGNFLGGWLGDLFHRRWSGGRLVALVVIQTVISPFGIAFRLLPPDSFMFPVCCWCQRHARHDDLRSHLRVRAGVDATAHPFDDDRGPDCWSYAAGSFARRAAGRVSC